MSTVRRRDTARLDLVEHFVFLAENAGVDLADRFLTNAEMSFNALAEQPKMGAPLSLRPPELAGLRKWRVKDFENYLIFYLPSPDGVSILRVLHGSRDWWSLLGIDG